MSENTFFRKWLEGKASDENILEEGNALFPDQEELDQYKKIIEASGNLELPKGNDKEAAWNNLLTKLESHENVNPISTETKVVKMNRFSYRKIAAVAAMFILAIALVMIFSQNQQIVHLTGNAEQKTIILPDNSTVILNAGSTISFDPSNWIENRIVSLKGEAFFNVKKGTKFEVISEVGKVGVLGTSFNVKARSNQYEVSCFTGKVEVFYGIGKPSKVLTKGLATKIDDSALTEPFGFVPNKVSGWQSGLFYFEAEPLSAVFNELERQFNVELTFNAAVADRLYSGHFKSGALAEALELVCLPMNLEFEIIDDKTIVIKENNE